MDEEDRIEQQFLPYSAARLRSREDALAELLRPCGRFRSPLSLMERARLRAFNEVGRAERLFDNMQAIMGTGVPLNWAAMLRYLAREGFIEKPRAEFPPMRNDLPKLYTASVPFRLDAAMTDGDREADPVITAHTLESEEAFSKVVGELLERSLLARYKRASLRHASFSELGRAALPLSDLNAFQPFQIKRSARLGRDEHSRFYWVEGKTLEGKRALLPAQLVFWNYDLGQDQSEPVLVHPSTSGAAGHFTRDEAILAGLLELIQRDGFLIYWLNNIAPQVVDVSELEDKTLRKLLSAAARYGLEVHFLDTTTDVGVPTIVCALLDRRAEDPVLAIGSSAGFDVGGTFVHAFQEALSVLNAVERHPAYELPADFEPFLNPAVRQLERLRLWRGAMVERFSFFLSGERKSARSFLGSYPEMCTPAERLANVLGSLRALGDGYEVYLYEPAHPALRTLGYCVMRTIVPRLVPLYLTNSLATLDARRLREVPVKLGKKAASKFNPWPHPFP